MIKKSLVLLQICLIGSAVLISSSASAEGCWKNTEGRGVGTVPGNCGPSLEKNGLLCYPKCKPGYTNVLGVCHNSYGRGVGYPWKIGDTLFSLADAEKRCNADFPKRGCEKSGALFYPKCAPGYKAVGCCLCQIETDAIAHSYVVSPVTPSCGPDEEYNAGLCYKKCRAGLIGVGPLCWDSCPAELPKDCGVLCGANLADCAKTAFNPIYAIGTAMFDLAKIALTMGGSIAETEAEGLATEAVEEAAKQAAIGLANQIKKSFPNLAGDALKNKLTEELKLAKIPDGIASSLVGMVLGADTPGFDYFNFIKNVDPTGLVAAFNSIKSQKRCPAS